MTTLYDQIPYTSFPYHDTHPDHLGLIGRLFKLDPARADGCRVLEIGCAAGGNLLPMAESYPNSTFVGIDLAGTSVADGMAVAATLGLKNVDLRQRDILHFDDDDLEPFDYVIAHGVYSWVPDPVKQKLLDIFAARLAPHGIGYVSHNVKPGFYMRQTVREMMRFHINPADPPERQVDQARGLLGFLISGVRTDERWRLVLQHELEGIVRIADWLLFHDQLAPVNDGCWFHEFAAELPPRGLQFLGDSDLNTMLPTGFPPEVDEALDLLAPDDLIRQEQYLDFLRNRVFRMTLVCRAERELDRAIKNEQILGLHVSSQATESDGAFRVPGSGLARTKLAVTRAAFEKLAAVWPASIPLQELAPPEDRLALAGDLIRCWIAGVVQLSEFPSRATGVVGNHPRATPLARLQARRGVHVTNLRHENGRMDEGTRALLGQLDGHHDRASLQADELLAKLARSGYLLAP